MPAQALILFAVAIWGISSPIAKYVLGYLTPSLTLTYRFLLITLVLTPIVIIKLGNQPFWRRISPKNWFWLTIMALLGSTGQIGLIYAGFSLTTALDGSLIISTSPIIVAIACWLVLKEKITKREAIGYFVATLGSVALIIEPLLNSQNLFTGSALGNLLVLCANFCWAGFILLSKTMLKTKYPAMFLTWFNFGIGFISFLVISLFSSNPNQLFSKLSNIPVGAHLGVIYLAFGAGILAYILYQSGLRKIEASEAEIFNYLIPIFAFPVSIVWLKEPITVGVIISTCLIICGVILAETEPKLHPKLKRRK